MKQRFLAVSTAVIAAVLTVGLPHASSAAAGDDAMREQWVKRYEELQARRAKLQQDYDSAVADYSRARTTRKNLPGEGKAGLVQEIARLKDELAKADQEVAEFPDVARAAGALPGWFRDVDSPASADDGQPTPARGLSNSSSRKVSTSSSRAPSTQEDAAPPASGAAEEDDAGGSERVDRSPSASSHGIPGRNDGERERRRLSH